jgi:hypothetical protein
MMIWHGKACAQKAKRAILTPEQGVSQEMQKPYFFQTNNQAVS